MAMPLNSYGLLSSLGCPIYLVSKNCGLSESCKKIKAVVG